MPIQTPQWTEFLSCAICRHEFDGLTRPPISLGCGHTLCKACLCKLHRRQCPFDQTNVSVEAEELPVNTALLQLVGVGPDEQEVHLYEKQSVLANFPEADLQCYRRCRKFVEDLALFLKNTNGCQLLSRPMQRKLVTLVTCQLAENEGKGRAVRAARSLGERSVTELILQHQNPQQLSANLWAAVRARGCQFLGPAMQEEVLRLVLLALEDGSALSRKVLVMFVVQRLEPHFPQASKTSIGHVVQLLYRASCFKVSKREGDSSLMQLKEEFRTYEALRREHDAQIVQIATEAGLRIAPDQWSSLLYGDSTHKSHMQSIIDKLQTPQSFGQSVQELVIALQRTGDPHNLSNLRNSLELLAAVDPSPDAAVPQLSECEAALEAARVVVRGLVDFIAAHGGSRGVGRQAESTHGAHGVKYKTSLCRDLLRGGCPRGPNCTFAHSEEEIDKYRFRNRKNSGKCVKAESLGSQESLDIAMGGEPEAAFYYPSGIHPPAALEAHGPSGRGFAPRTGYVPSYGIRQYGPTVYAPPPPSALYGTAMYGAASLPQPEYGMPAPAPLGDYRSMETARLNPSLSSQNLLSLQNRKQEILEQLEKIGSSAPAAPVQPLHNIWNSVPLQGASAAGRAVSSGLYRDMTAAGSRIDDDDFVPFDATHGSKYGPISPMTRPLQQRRLQNLYACDWYDSGSTGRVSESERMKIELESLKKQIDELRMATLESVLTGSRQQHLAQELDLIEDNIREKERELRLTQRKRRNGSMVPMDEEDNGIANGMRELELRLQHDLEDPE